MSEHVWRKSSRSGTYGTDCVEVAVTPQVAVVRDSKDPDGARLRVSVERWSSFLADLKVDRYGG